MEAATASGTALVTGGESGIGRACAIALAQAGRDVAILYFRDADAAAETARGVTAAGRRAACVQADVGDEAAVEAAFDAAVNALGPVTCLVNSAGLNMSGTPVAEMALGGITFSLPLYSYC